MSNNNNQVTNPMVQALHQSNTQYTTTENGQTALTTTGSALVDLFGVIGAVRNRPEQEVLTLFEKAFLEDALLATKMLFYARNVRGGLGERDIPRLLWKHLGNHYPDIMIKNIAFVPLFGRWDDLYSFVGTPVEQAAWDLIRDVWHADLKSCQQGESVSLLAKWLKTPDASSPETRTLGRLTARRLGMTSKEYQNGLRKLRRYLNVVEVKMSANQWTEINFAHVPSQAMLLYRNAFKRHNPEGFEAFLNAVERGEEKVNASTLYPYNILEAMNVVATMGGMHATYDPLLEQQWKALPNYIEGENNFLVMADTSASMNGRPMATAIGLAIYFAERNFGAYHNCFMTFSSNPRFVGLVGNTLYDKVRSIKSIVEDTNLEKAFQLVFHTAVQNNIPQEQLPKSIIVISDMEINKCMNSRTHYELFYDQMKRQFAEHGYTIPNLVFWNVDSRKDAFHVHSGIPGVQLASGQSPSVFKELINSIGFTGFDAMVKTLSNPIYDGIKI